MFFGLDPTLGDADRPVHRASSPGSAGRAFGIFIAAVLKSIDDFSYVTSTVHHAAVPRRGHVLPAERAAGVGAATRRTPTRCSTASSSCTTPRSASRAGSTSATSRSSSAFALVDVAARDPLHGAPRHRLSRAASALPSRRSCPQCWTSSRRSLLLELEPPFEKRDVQLARRRHGEALAPRHRAAGQAVRARAPPEGDQRGRRPARVARRGLARRARLAQRRQGQRRGRARGARRGGPPRLRGRAAPPRRRGRPRRSTTRSARASPTTRSCTATRAASPTPSGASARSPASTSPATATTSSSGRA